MDLSITIRPAALQQLKEISYDAGEGIRIGSSYVGSCSLFADYQLSIDRKQEGDDAYEVEGIPFYVSDKSKAYLHSELFIDFSPSLGYKLSSPEEVYKYDLSLKRAAE